MTDYCCYSGNSNSFIKLMLVMMNLMVVIMITMSLLMMTDNDQISERTCERQAVTMQSPSLSISGQASLFFPLVVV